MRRGPQARTTRRVRPRALLRAPRWSSLARGPRLVVSAFRPLGGARRVRSDPE
jgi:hypothetical protein